MVYEPFFHVEQLTETTDLELKRAGGKDNRGELPASVFSTYSAMANTQGGTILLGVTWDKEAKAYDVSGIVDTDKVLKELWDALNDRKRISHNLLANEDVSVQQAPNGRAVIGIRIPRAKRPQRPVYVGENPIKGTYRRNHEGDYLCDTETVKRMLAEQIEDARDAKIVGGFGLVDLDPETLRAYRIQFRAVRSTHPWNDHDDVEFLRCLGGWARDRQNPEVDGPTIAGLLMFGRLRSILDALPHYIVDYQERPAPRRDERWLDRVTTDGTWSGNLYDFYRTVMRKLGSDLKVPFRLRGTERVDESSVHEAIREALVNTLVHADYSGHVSVLVVKRPDLFGFRNPGLMRVAISDAMRGGVSDCRNRNLQKMFQLAGLGEQAGSGIPKIYQNWREQHWRTPVISEKLEPDQTLLTMHMSSLLPDEAITALDERFGSAFRGMEEIERLALATVEVEGSVTHARLKSMVDAHPSDVSKALSGLVRDGHLESAGASRGTFYFFPGGNGAADLDFLVDANMLSLAPLPGSENRRPRAGSGVADDSRDSVHNEIATPPSSVHNATSSVQNETASERYPTAAAVRESRRSDPETVRAAILQVCQDRFVTIRELASELARTAETLRVHYVTELVRIGRLELRFPEQLNHPEQSYRTTDPSNTSAAE